MSHPVILTSFMYPHEAHMAANYLHSEGVNTFMQDELTVQVDNFYSNAIGGVKIMVAEEDFELGKSVLIKGGYIKPDRPKEEIKVFKLPRDNQVKTCPFCHSNNIDINKTPHYLSLVLMFIVHAFFPISEKRTSVTTAIKNGATNVKIKRIKKAETSIDFCLFFA